MHSALEWFAHNVGTTTIHQVGRPGGRLIATPKGGAPSTVASSIIPSYKDAHKKRAKNKAKKGTTILKVIKTKSKHTWESTELKK